MNKFILIIVPIVLIASCTSPVQQVIKQAGENGGELQKVLDYFKADTCKEKYEAAQFLIKNMPIHYSFDSLAHADYWKVFNRMRELARQRDYSTIKQKENLLDSLINVSSTLQHNSNYRKIHFDCANISSAFLIRDIESAFETYRNSPYHQACSYDRFLEYILPYRVCDQLLLHDWRSYLKENYSDIFNKYYQLSPINAVDSVLWHCKTFEWGSQYKNKIPLLHIKDFEEMGFGPCRQRAIYNKMLLAAFGIPCAIDFVPAWGNISSRHTWNVLLANDTIYPFDPFPDKKMWNLKNFYNNKNWDRKYGEFRLPKVFRETYSINLLDINKDSEVEQKNIPLLFKRYNYIDVSEQYFEPTDISVTINDDIPADVRYMYICVFQRGNWKPVWYGKINDNKKVVFNKMGKRIIYNIGYYRDNRIYTIGTPFYVNSTGLKEPIEPDIKKHEKVLIKRALPQYPEHVWFIEYLKNCQLQAGNDENWQNYDTLTIIPDSMLNGFNTWHIPSEKRYKYLRFVFPKDSLMVGEIEVYGENKIDLSSCLYGVSSGISKDDVQLLFDGSGYNECFIAVNNKDKNNQLNCITWKLNKPLRIQTFKYCPCIKSYFYDDMQYELLYWYKNRWITVVSMPRMPIQPTEGLAGESPKLNCYIEYDNVPKNALLYLRQLDNNKYVSYNRIFKYKNGIQEWH